MSGIDTIIQSGCAVQTLSLLPADLSARPAASSIRMKMQHRIPRTGFSQGQAQWRPSVGYIAGPPAGFGFALSQRSRIPNSHSHGRECSQLLARGRNRTEMLCLAIELRTNSADILFDTYVDSQSHLTICED